MTDAELQQLLVLDDAPGPALAIDAWRANEIIEAALDGAGFGPSGGGSSAGKAGGKASGASTGAAIGTKLAIVAAVVIIVAAIVLLMARGRRDDGQSAPPPLPDAAIDSSVGSGTLAVASDAAQAAVDPEDIVIDEPAPPPPPTPTPPRPKPKRDESPADLLGEANAKRAAKQWRESDELYARVVERAPKSLAAQTALIASASLRLEHLGDPKGALQRFRRALAIAPKGALAEDARWGVAEAARAIGNRAAEAAALDEFLAHHASSPLAPRAKARRAELP
jgi:tetratricopeptide (TPR) repeat protein